MGLYISEGYSSARKWVMAQTDTVRFLYNKEPRYELPILMDVVVIMNSF